MTGEVPSCCDGHEECDQDQSRDPHSIGEHRVRALVAGHSHVGLPPEKKEAIRHTRLEIKAEDGA